MSAPLQDAKVHLDKALEFLAAANSEVGAGEDLSRLALGGNVIPRLDARGFT